MTDWSTIAQATVQQAAPGASARLLILPPAPRTPGRGARPTRCVVHVVREGETLAVAGGPDEASAWRMLCAILTRAEGPALETEEIAALLGVVRQRVRAMQAAGQLRPAIALGGSASKRYAPTEVWRAVEGRLVGA